MFWDRSHLRNEQLAGLPCAGRRGWRRGLSLMTRRCMTCASSPSRRPRPGRAAARAADVDGCSRGCEVRQIGGLIVALALGWAAGVALAAALSVPWTAVVVCALGAAGAGMLARPGPIRLLALALLAVFCGMVRTGLTPPPVSSGALADHVGPVHPRRARAGRAVRTWRALRGGPRGRVGHRAGRYRPGS